MKAFRKAMSGAERALWLSELSQAIDEAQWLAWRIGVVEGRNAQALELYVRLELVRAEVEAIRGLDLRSLRRPASNAVAAISDSLRQLAASRERLEE